MAGARVAGVAVSFGVVFKDMLLLHLKQVEFMFMLLKTKDDF